MVNKRFFSIVFSVLFSMQLLLLPNSAVHAAVSDPWTFKDIGSQKLAGTSSYNNGEFSISGGGADIWGTSDEFSYVYREINDDNVISTRVISQTNTNDGAKAGIMFRESTAANSKYVDLVVTPYNVLTLQWRSGTGGSCNYKALGTFTLPAYIMLVRTGDSFNAYKSNDGVNWGRSLGSCTVSMNKSVKAGMGVTSRNAGKASTAKFDHVTVGGTVPVLTTKAIAGGGGSNGSYSMILKKDGTVWTWGDNSHGQLGNGSTKDRSKLVQVQDLYNMIDIAGGTAHTIALKWDGTVWAWGSNEYGQLGEGTTEDKSLPVQAKGLNDVADIAGGSSHTIALKKDGTVWTWGCNTSGQLGDGTTEDKYIPAQVQGLNDIIAVAGGTAHTIALKKDGTVWTWGNNDYGQLGDGTTEDKHTPVLVQGLNGVIAVAGGYQHTLALKKDGTVWTWGNNDYGQLGDGTTEDRHTPVQVQGLNDVITVAGGYQHAIALKKDGTVWTWGNNDYGQLGDGTTEDRKIPIQVQGLSNVTAIAGGYQHTIVLKRDATVWTWGWNKSGQLGDGTATSSGTPVQVSGLSNSFPTAILVSTTKTFTDLDNYPWAKEAIITLVSKDIIKGASEKTYEPGKNITRADFITLLVRVFDLKAEFNSNFEDVRPGAYYYQAVGVAQKLGIISGAGSNKFNPGDKITREDLMVMVARTLKIAKKASATGTIADISGFNDTAQVAPYAVEGVATLLKEGIVTGSGKMIYPKGSATRAETAVILYRIYNKYMK